MINDFLFEATALTNDLMALDHQLILHVFNNKNVHDIQNGEISFNDLLENNLGINIELTYNDLVEKYQDIERLSISSEMITDRLIEGTIAGQFRLDGFDSNNSKIEKCCGQKMFDFVVSFSLTAASCTGCPVTLVSCGSCAVGAALTAGLFKDTLDCSCWS